MSGYLERMAARAVGRPGAARPRTPARFEPPDLGVPAPPGPTSPVPAADGTSVRTTAPAPTSEGIAPSAAPAGAARRTSSTAPTPEPGGPRASGPPPSTATRPASDEPVPAARADSVPVAPAPAAPADSSPPTSARRRDEDGPAGKPGHALGDARPVDPPRLVAARPADHAATTGRGHAAPSHEGAGAGHPEAGEPDVVHVSIGRVEVRTTLRVPEARPAPRPRESAVSLQDYLRRRRR